ncbi:hypothetical protein FIBSPDRAFT_924237 [Athelia psychrophila]|uniref:Uncharacterized protein n=1 Tax=Athelia psychrophila TaxID=1759441 RepID=A0A166WIL8_9AGAM|nr:hypothetical protein FIBSPDRAFT_924237 [Fibularhizoctonia sp. CBS 109695]
MSNYDDDDNLTLCVPRASSGQNPHQPVLVRTPKPDLTRPDAPKNHVLIKVDRFGFSANNVTYQALGEAPHFRYFDFHPAPTATDPPVSPATHGLIPVWGFGTVAASTHPRIQPGERVYGYLAPARYLLLPVSPTDVNTHAFYVPRPALPADRRPYNQITRCAADPLYNPSPNIEDLTMLYRPLFWTAYWCEDWLFAATTPAYRGATRILVSSASSKTAFCLAYLIRKRAQKEKMDVRVVGLTSKGNVAFTRGLGLYDVVYDYDSLTSLSVAGDKEGAWVYADVAGNDALNARVFAHLGARLAAGIQLGLTNLSPSAPAASSTKWSTNTFADPSPTSPSSPAAPAPAATGARELEQFFMPEWLTLRRHQLPVRTIAALQAAAWAALMRDCAGWVRIGRVAGGAAVVDAYTRFGSAGGPDVGWVWSLWENESAKL